MNRDQTNKETLTMQAPTPVNPPVPPAGDQTNKEPLTMQGVADVMNVSRPTAWRWALTGVKGVKLISYLHGGRRVVDSADLEKFRQQLKQRPLGTNCETSMKSGETIHSNEALAADEALESLLTRPAQRQNRPPRTINSRTESQ